MSGWLAGMRKTGLSQSPRPSYVASLMSSKNGSAFQSARQLSISLANRKGRSAKVARVCGWRVPDRGHTVIHTGNAGEVRVIRPWRGHVSDEGETAAVHVSDSQGVQVGAGGIQQNIWATVRAGLDTASLSALNLRTAVSRLQQASYDDVVDLFASSTGDHMTHVLRALLLADEARVVAVLADINRPRATELINLLAVDAPWLSPLLEGADAISDKAACLKWVDAGRLERFDGSYARHYKGGRLFWSKEYGVLAVGNVMEIYRATTGGWLGLPIGEQEPRSASPFGTDGIRQSFEAGVIYSSKHGTYGVHSVIMPCYEAEGDSAGWLGFPVAESTGDSGAGEIQRFEGGGIYRSSHEESFTVQVEVMQAISGDQTMVPISQEVTTVSSRSTQGRLQRFRSPEGRGHETAVYSSAGRSVVVDPRVWNYYRDLGGEASWLGFPIDRANALLHMSRFYGDNTLKDFSQRAFKNSFSQNFEGGTIFWGINNSPRAVPIAVVKVIDIPKIVRSVGMSPLQQARPTTLGWPVSDEQSVGTQGTDRIQFFEDGVVTLRNGKREIWKRPSK